MAQKPDGKAAKTERVTFTRPAAERIAKTVRRVEQGDRGAEPLVFDRIGVSSPFALKLATFTGNWETGTYKTVTLSGSTQTASVYNWCNPALGGNTASSTQSRYVIFGKVGGTNSAVEIQMQATSHEQIRVCTFTGSWSINQTKTLTFQGSTPNTVVATNQLFTIGDACTEQIAYIAKVPTVEQQNNPAWHLLNVQHHETAVITSVSLTTAAMEFTRIRAWIPYPGETATLSLPISAETACS